MRETDYTLDELIGRDTVDLVDPRDLKPHIAERERALAGGTTMREFRIRRRDGSSFWVEARTRHRVLVAESGEHAIAVDSAHEGAIDLLFTDVVMPGMHGITLAEALRAARPGLRVLVTSDYTPEEVDRRVEGLAELPFLPKPYTRQSSPRRSRGCSARGSARRAASVPAALPGGEA